MIHAVDFTGGVKSSGEAVCLMLKPLAGSPAKQFYPAELAQSVEWVHRACLSNKSFTDTSGTPPLKQGSQAVAGIQLAGGEIDCRIVWDEAKHQIRLETAGGTVQGLEGATLEQIIDKTNQPRTSWNTNTRARCPGDDASAPKTRDSTRRRCTASSKRHVDQRAYIRRHPQG